MNERATRFERLLDQRLLASYRLASAILANAVDGEDAVQDAALRAWRSFGSLRDESRFSAWFDRILVNVCRARLRGRKPPVTVAAATTVQDSALAVGEHEALARAMNRLTPEHRITVVLRYLEDLTIDQIADRTSARPGTVKSRLHYALAALRAAYLAEDDPRQ